MKYSELCLAHISTHWVLYTQLFSSLWQHSRDRWLSPSCHIHNLSWYLSQQSFLGSVKLFFLLIISHCSCSDCIWWSRIILTFCFPSFSSACNWSFSYYGVVSADFLDWVSICHLLRDGASPSLKKKKRRSDVSTSYVSKARERR